MHPFGSSRQCPCCDAVCPALVEQDAGVCVPALKYSLFQQQELVRAHESVTCKACEYVVKKVMELIDNNRTEVPCAQMGACVCPPGSEGPAGKLFLTLAGFL